MHNPCEPPFQEDEVLAATRGICMVPKMSGIDRRVATAVLLLSEAEGFTAASPSSIAHGLGVSEGRVVGALQRLASRGLIRTFFEPDLAALAALWTAPPGYYDWQGDDEEV